RAERLARQGEGAGELVALELREALDALGGILGCGADDGVLQRIFSRFCIGK
ncbi:MAG: tRNA uridine-5-carboxymethylaminomethyl(34) synthesis GTPase MnmE, partial [Phycisphaerae bacterium]